ncbi:hypothetical protein AX14_006491 [Amanita brunnescens Koide BX004]|nr:hypothetical protein AX14_006491 [Amanita brunnescens Koide BX004]
MSMPSSAMSVALMENPSPTLPRAAYRLAMMPSSDLLGTALVSMSTTLRTAWSPPPRLHERVGREFSELRIYEFWEKAVEAHPTPMSEVNVFTSHQMRLSPSIVAHCPS